MEIERLDRPAKLERYRGTDGKVDRVSFVWWPGVGGRPDLTATGPRFKGGKRFHVPGVGYVLDTHPDMEAIVGSPSKMTVATVIAVWPTNFKGELDKERFVGGEVDVRPWIMSGSTHECLTRRHNEFHFGESDLSIKCTDAQAQKLDLASCKGNLYKTAMDIPKLATLAQVIHERVTAIESQIEGLIARVMTVDGLRERVAAVAVPSGPFDDFTLGTVPKGW